METMKEIPGTEFPSFDVTGQVALVTGATRGLGRAIALTLAHAGADVVLGVLRPGSADDVVQRIEAMGRRALAVPMDVSDLEQIQAGVEAAVEHFGRLDILVNNAGIFRILPMMQTSVEDYQRIIDVNQLGVFLGMKAATGPLIDGGGGSIINISSIAGLRGSSASLAYSASKWAVRGMTKCAALELAPFKVRVNSVHPGIIDTPMAQEFVQFGVLDAVRERIPWGELASPDEVAKLTLFLASDDSTYCTGCEFIVDGGMTTGI